MFTNVQTTKAREETPPCFGTSPIDQDAKAPMTVWSGINQTMGMKCSLFSTQKTCGTITFQILKHCNLYNTLHKNIRKLDGECWKVVVESIFSPILLDFKTPECKLQTGTTIRCFSCQIVFICWIWCNQYFLLKHASWWQRSTVPYSHYNNICCWECI